MLSHGNSDTQALFNYNPKAEAAEQNLPKPPQEHTPPVYPPGSTLANPDPYTVTRLNLYDTATKLGVPTNTAAVPDSTLAEYAKLTDLPMSPASPRGNPTLKEIRNQYPKDSIIGRVDPQVLANVGDSAYGAPRGFTKHIEIVGAQPLKPLSRAAVRQLARDVRRGGVRKHNRDLANQLDREVFALDSNSALPTPPRYMRYSLAEWAAAMGNQCH
jgi:hypothetical protein